MFKLFYVFAQDSVISGSSIFLTVFILNTCTTVVYVNFSKNSSQPFLAKRGAKVRIFIFIFQIFSKVFSIYFFGSSFGTTSGHSLGSSNLIPRFHLSGFLNPSFIMSPPHLSRLRVQKYCCKTYSPNIFPTFLQLFFTFIDCQQFINALFSVLLLSTPFFISPF